MKKSISLIVLCVLFSCKKEPQPTLIGTWVALDFTYQFTIKDLNGSGISNFTLKKDSLIWKLNDQTNSFKLVRLNIASLTLEEKGKPIYFRKVL